MTYPVHVDHWSHEPLSTSFLSHLSEAIEKKIVCSSNVCLFNDRMSSGAVMTFRPVLDCVSVSVLRGWSRRVVCSADAEHRQCALRGSSRVDVTRQGYDMTRGERCARRQDRWNKQSASVIINRLEKTSAIVRVFNIPALFTFTYWITTGRGFTSKLDQPVGYCDFCPD